MTATILYSTNHPMRARQDFFERVIAALKKAK